MAKRPIANTYRTWQNDLATSIGENGFIKGNNIVVTYIEQGDSMNAILLVEKKGNSITINTSNYEKYYDTVAEPVYPREKSIKDATKTCTKLIKEWCCS